jgi:hypothetical protein
MFDITSAIALLNDDVMKSDLPILRTLLTRVISL